MDLLKIIKESNGENTTLKQKLESIKNLIQGYYRLEKGIINQQIFQNEDVDSNESKRIVNSLDEIDYHLIEEVLTKNTKKILTRFELKNKIDFNEKKDFLQVGINTIFINGPFKGLWTTGKATFFLPVSKNVPNNLIVTVFSLIPAMIIIGHDEKILKKITIKKFQTKSIKISVNCGDVEIIELFINVEKRWRPDIITKKSNNIPMGVNIKSIMVCKA